MRLFLILTILFSATCHALETDNYIVWDRELRDVSGPINSFINNEIVRILETRPESCESAVKLISKSFASHLVHDNPIEDELFKILSESQLEIYPGTINYVDRSIYRDPYRVYIPYFGLAPNIQVNGYYFGTDKLSHFGTPGYIYLQRYFKAKRKGLSEEASMKHAIDWGVWDENRVHGFWASGVYSYADLEANFKGFLFYKSLCGDRLQKQGNEWKLVKPFDIKEYVNGFWDESFYESYRKPGNWKKVSPALEAYCDARHSKLVRDRFAYYQKTSIESYSMIYLKSLQVTGSKDVPLVGKQSLSQICAETTH
jgi:hypothetical protein